MPQGEMAQWFAERWRLGRDGMPPDALLAYDGENLPDWE
jgi:hypothetical protein